MLVVDDSAFMRRLVSDLVSSTGEFEVAGTARDGIDALRQVQALAPDLITLDVDMPMLDGLGVLERIMADSPRPVIMLSAGGADGGAEDILRALDLGAVDFVRKPAGRISLDLDLVREQLLAALRAASLVRQVPAPVYLPAPVRREPAGVAPLYVVCIAASTGGPAALGQIIPRLHCAGGAVLVVQHMPIGFTAGLAARLHRVSRMAVQEAVHDEALYAGRVYIAPGGWHLQLGGSRERPSTQLDQRASMWGVRPAADLLFASAARLFDDATMGVVLTGMGRDGADGLSAIRRAGGFGVVQDRASAVIPGMPEAALRVAGADDVVPLLQVADSISWHGERLQSRLRERVAT